MRTFIRRNRVDERRAAAIAGVCAVPALFSGCSPTGSVPVDIVLVAVAVAAGAWLSASSAWWSLALLAGLGVAFGGSWPTALGAVALVGSWWIGQRNDHLSDARVVVASLAFQSIVWSTAALAPWQLVVVVVVVVSTIVGATARRPSRVRRLARWSLAGVVVGSIVATAALALIAAGSRRSVDDSRVLAREAIAALRAGDVDGAVASLDAAARSATQAGDRLGGVWTQPARLVPVVAQHRAALATLTGDSAQQLRRAADALATIDTDALRIVDGRIDVAAIEALTPAVDEMAESVAALAGSFERAESRWLVPPVRRRLENARTEVDEQADLLGAARDLVRVAPRLLGAEGGRRYLVLFTTPSEARGVGGFSGNFAEVTVDDGVVALGDFGRTSELDEALVGRSARCEPCPTELVQGYGAFGLTTGVDGTVGEVPWKNLTMPAHFPYVASAAQVLYEAAGRGRVDGVAVMDPYVMRRFLRYTGPVRAEGVEQAVSADRILPFVLFEQYLTESNVERIDALDGIGRAVIGALLGGSLPDPVTLASDLLPLVGERRLLLWTDEGDEQDAMSAVGLTGGLPSIDPAVDAGFGVTVNNAGANKVDAFLEVAVEAEVVDVAPSRRLVVDVTLTNTAPTEGLPNYIIGNPFGLPLGTNRYYISFYGAVLPTSVERDGVPIGVGTTTEAGWAVAHRFDHLGPGRSTTYRLEFDVPASFGSIDDLVSFSQSLVRSRADLGRRAPRPS